MTAIASGSKLVQAEDRGPNLGPGSWDKVLPREPVLVANREQFMILGHSASLSLLLRLNPRSGGLLLAITRLATTKPNSKFKAVFKQNYVKVASSRLTGPASECIGDIGYLLCVGLASQPAVGTMHVLDGLTESFCIFEAIGSYTLTQKKTAKTAVP
jgi:hypothetical protein